MASPIESRAELLRGIELFNGREFFECHEALEDVWRPERGPRRLFLQSLIHVAVGLYHHERGNAKGAQRQLRKALRKLGPFAPVYEGIDTGRLHREVEKCLDGVLRGAAFPYPVIAFLEGAG